MDILFNKNYKKIHFVGILGSSMSSLAVLAKNFGYQVSGSDLDISNKRLTKLLLDKQIPLYSSHSCENIQDIDVLVYSSSIKADNPELKQAVLNKICIVERGKFLGLIARQYACSIAICGAHGKTTASGLIADIFCKLTNASFHIGGELCEFKSNFLDLGKEFFVTEACEYKGNFLSLTPSVGVILNIEFDHPDYFENLDDTIATFAMFASKCKQLIVNSDCDNIKRIRHNNIIKYSIHNKNADIYAENIRYFDDRLKLDIVYNEKVYKIDTAMVGEFNAYNILAAFAVCTYYCLDLEKAVEIINSHLGIKRRSEKISLENKTVLLDYAHHPTQIKSMIKLYSGSEKLLCIFEPHTYSRTRALLYEFTNVLISASEVILLPIYAAREPIDESLLDILCDNIKTRIPCQIMTPNEALNYAKTFEGKVLFLGAGNIDKIFE